MLIDLRDDRRGFIKISFFALFTLFDLSSRLPNTSSRLFKTLFRQSVDSLINQGGWDWVYETAEKAGQQDLVEVMQLWEAFAGVALAHQKKQLLNEDGSKVLRRAQARMLYPNRKHFTLLNDLLPLYGKDIGKLTAALENCYILSHIPDPALKQRLDKYFDERRQNVQALVENKKEPTALSCLNKYNKDSPDSYFIKGLLQGPYVTSHLKKDSLSLPVVDDEDGLLNNDYLKGCYEDVTPSDSPEAFSQRSRKLQKLVGYLASRIIHYRHSESIDTLSNRSLKGLKTIDAVVQVLLKKQLTATPPGQARDHLLDSLEGEITNEVFDCSRAIFWRKSTDEEEKESEICQKEAREIKYAFIESAVREARVEKAIKECISDKNSSLHRFANCNVPDLWKTILEMEGCAYKHPFPPRRRIAKTLEAEEASVEHNAKPS